MLYISGSIKEEVVEEDDETECIDIKEEIYKSPEVESIAGNSVLLCLILFFSKILKFNLSMDDFYDIHSINSLEVFQNHKMIYFPGTSKEELEKEEDESVCIDVKEEIYREPEFEKIPGNIIFC